MSPLGHNITAFSMAINIMHFHSTRWGDGFRRLPSIIIHQDITQIDKTATVTLVALGILIGARGPDRLEIPRFDKRTKTRRSIIPHRTLTHWPFLWVCMALFSWYLRSIATDVLVYEIALVGYGFALSGLLHLAMDILTPTGIPLLMPFGKRTSLSVFKSSEISEWCFVLFFVVSSQLLTKLFSF